MPKIYRDCVQCKNDFYISEKDQLFFERRDLALPRRCYRCRKTNREEADAVKLQQKQLQSPNGGTTQSCDDQWEAVDDDAPEEPGYEYEDTDEQVQEKS